MLASFGGGLEGWLAIGWLAIGALCASSLRAQRRRSSQAPKNVLREWKYKHSVRQQSAYEARARFSGAE
jgi:hypothetical protein